MKRTTFAWLGMGSALLLSAHAGYGQIGGNAVYGGDVSGRVSGAGTPARNERSKRELTPSEQKADGNATYLDAAVLMNVKADEYVAVFGIATEGANVLDANAKMDASLAQFKTALRELGVKDESLFVDFVAQNRIYSYRLGEKNAQEELTGFELKKNVNVRFTDKNLLDALIQAAARAQIFDLIKVDYVVKDTLAIQERLRAEAARVLKSKVTRYATQFGLKLYGPLQVVVDSPSIYYPVEQYRSYTAAEAENVDKPDERGDYVVKEARKSRTFYFEPLSNDGFDTVINPLGLEPVVQFTAYLRARYSNTNGRK